MPVYLVNWLDVFLLNWISNYIIEIRVDSMILTTLSIDFFSFKKFVLCFISFIYEFQF